MKDLRCLIGMHKYIEHDIDGGHGTYQECCGCGTADGGFEPTGKGVIKTIDWGG